MKRLALQQRGDTIVEVLISLAVLSLVIGGAYSIANAALRNSRQAQERAEATKLAESQLEAIKSMPGEITGGASFCVDATGAVEYNSTIPDNYVDDDYTGYHPDCRGRNTSGLYNVFITKNGLSYTVNVRWDRIGGGKEQLQMSYRGYE